MKVAIVTRYFLPARGGIEVHCYNLAKELLKKGIDAEIHTSKDTFTERGVLREYEIIDQVKVFRHKAFWRFVPKGYDIIHLHNFNIFPHFWIFLITFVRRLFKMKAPKLIVTLHGGFAPWWEGFSILAKIIKQIYHKTLGKFFLNHVVDKIIAVSEWEKKQLVKEGIKEEKIVVIPNGVEELAYTLPKQRGKYMEYEPYLLFIGRIDKLKNIDLAVKYLKGLNDVNLVIAGHPQDKEYYCYLIKLVSDLGLVGRVIFLGEVTGKEKYELIDNALALILLSHSETDPIVVKEAMARGKPVIVSDVVTFKHLIKNGRNGFMVSNQRGFEKAVKLLLTNNALRSRISKFNKERAISWRWQSVAEATARIYREVISSE